MYVRSESEKEKLTSGEAVKQQQWTMIRNPIMLSLHNIHKQTHIQHITHEKHIHFLKILVTELYNCIAY